MDTKMHAVTESLNPIKNPSLFSLTQATAAALMQVEPDPETGELIGIDRFDALALDTQEKLIDCACAVANFEGLVAQLEEQERELARRKKFVKSLIDHIKGRCVDAMELLEIKSIKAAPVQIRLHPGESVEVFDLPSVPSEYFHMPKVTPKLDKTELKTAIKSGIEVPGVRLVKQNRLVVK